MPSCSLEHETVRWEGPEPCWYCGGRPIVAHEQPEDDYYDMYGGVW